MSDKNPADLKLVRVEPAEPIKLEPAEYYKLRMLTADIAVTKETAMKEAQDKVAESVTKRDAYLKSLAERYPRLAHGRFNTDDDACELIPV